MFFKKLAGITLGVGLSFLAGLLTLLTLNSENPILFYAAAGTILTALGGLLIGGLFVATIIGRDICERIFGWFY